MMLFIGIQLIMIFMFLFFGWAIVKKKWYGLISNFNGRPEDEQQQLIKNGYPQRVGKLMFATALGMALLLPLSFTSFQYSLEVQFGFMMLFLLGGLIYLSKYEIKEKRKRSYIFSSLIAIGTIGFIVGLFFTGYQDFELKDYGDSFEITGMYGEVWDYANIRHVELLEEMPEVTWKENGFGLATLAKGHFKVMDYGSSLLFIHKDSQPYLFIETEKDKIFINSKNSNETKEWYEILSSKTK
ncbi:DUF3784 domain-containing protein [Mesobacillus selenatarsenatis]|uniref:DUF3784 domain-containing protein n=1 Tax=Mesobacillus selenatarsenatis TaxID=388741 RepID=A0A846TZ50_9BACI|nr:DUF3784 domain-containing protein [Mesobacillus selenatarsenatis]NKE06896.1 DUF3784 domain-containing protein [Mesobacillus selenatarsenatis]